MFKMFKLDIGDPKSKKTFHLETASEAFIGKKLGDTIKGSDIPKHKDLNDYEFVIAGASDKAGFPALADVEGVDLKRVLLKRGIAMRKKKPKGLRLRKTVHGNTIDENIVQINLKVSKQGAKPLAEIFKKPEEAKPVEEKPEEKPAPVEETKIEKLGEEKPTAEAKPEEKPTEEKAAPETKLAVKEEEPENQEEKKEAKDTEGAKSGWSIAREIWIN